LTQPEESTTPTWAGQLGDEPVVKITVVRIGTQQPDRRLAPW
jgi:hypothetical protein